MPDANEAGQRRAFDKMEREHNGNARVDRLFANQDGTQHVNTQHNVLRSLP